MTSFASFSWFSGVTAIVTLSCFLTIIHITYDVVFICYTEGIYTTECIHRVDKIRMTNYIDESKSIAYLEDGEFVQFVEYEGAREIKGSAKDAGFNVEDFGCFFNVVYKKGVSIDVQ